MKMLGTFNPVFRQLARLLPSDNPLRERLARVWRKTLAAADSPVQIVLNGQRTWLSSEWRSIKSDYEADAVNSFLAAIQPGNTVWDIGAHIGLYTILAARKLGRSGTVVAWEPAPKSFEQMARHIALNGLSERCRLIQEVISDGAQSELTFELEGGIDNGIDNRIGYEHPNKPWGTQITVTARSIDDWATRGEPVPDIIKMDVEGAEILALRGGRRLFTGQYGKRPRILLSVHPAYIEEYGLSTEVLAQTVRELGYQPVALDGGQGDLSAFGELWLEPLALKPFPA
jgi:FkbM family methyltransferase